MFRFGRPKLDGCRGHDRAGNGKLGWKTGRRRRWMWGCMTRQKRRSLSLGGAPTQRSPRPGHRDTSTTRRGLPAVDRSPGAGLRARRIEADGGPGWPIRLAAERRGGGVRENGTWGRSGHPGPISYAKMLISGCAGQFQ